MSVHIYADTASLDVLRNDREKLLLIGSDFGYGNFGDVLQHLNTLSLVGEVDRFATVSVMDASAIGFRDFPLWAKRHYGSDAFVYVSESPLKFEDDAPALHPVTEVARLGGVYLYGGGFLNAMWGDFVLEIVAHFLRAAPNATYLVSGQQVTPPYQSKVVEHCRQFEPKLFAVRDELSQRVLQESGYDPDFSFDDATEALLDLSSRAGLRRGSGVLAHLNSSSYSASLGDRGGVREDLCLLSADSRTIDGVTFLQAYRDARPEIVDTRETIKRLETSFPFHDYRVVETVGLAYGSASVRDSGGIVGSLGYSCSYHIALWLQLSGIPCWLRSDNSFYAQKSQALQVRQNFESFLGDPLLADHRLNLERRGRWRERVRRLLGEIPPSTGVSKFRVPDEQVARPFVYKGAVSLDPAGQGADVERLERLDRENAAIEEAISSLERSLRATEEALARSERDLESRDDRISGLTALVTELGHEVHVLRESSLVRSAIHQGSDGAAADPYADGALQGVALEQLEQVLTSRSWKYTRPLRAVARFCRSGRFDSAGTVGLRELARAAGRKLPLREDAREWIGALRNRVRRRG